VYWIPVYQILESRGLEVYLVNAQPWANFTKIKAMTAARIKCPWRSSIQLLYYGFLLKVNRLT
jgi:hypothetical protein